MKYLLKTCPNLLQTSIFLSTSQAFIANIKQTKGEKVLNSTVSFEYFFASLVLVKICHLKVFRGFLIDFSVYRQNRDVLFLKFGQRGGSWKNFSEIGVYFKGGDSLRKESGGPNCFISFSSEKHIYITVGKHIFVW